MSRFNIAWLVVWGSLSSTWCLTAAQELDATLDEPFYLRAGLNSWRTGSNRELMKAGTMPLPVDTQYLPIYIWEQVRGEPFDTEKDFHKILPYARATNLVFWWLLLTYGFLVARRFGGDWAGRFAVVLLATEPSFLAHASLATTDIALTAMMLAFAYYYDRGRDGDWRQRWLIPGAVYGIAMAAKVSALMFVPIVVLALELPRWIAAGAFRPPAGVGRWRHFWQETTQYRRDNWKIFLIGMVVVFTYCGCDWKVHPKIVMAADKLPSHAEWTPPLRWLAHHTPIFPNAGEAFQFQARHNLHGHGAYVVGEWHPRATWYYFPVALSIKLTLPVLLLVAGLLLIRPRSLATPSMLAFLFLLIFSLNCRVQIGIRLVFPLIAFLLVAIAASLARSLSSSLCVSAPLREKTSDRTKRRRDAEKNWKFASLASVAIACTIPPLHVWPDGLRYSNELWGGPEKTHLHLSDSNMDWGQGTKDLDAWTTENNLPLAKVWYYGLDPAIVGNRERELPLHQHPFQSPEDVWPHVQGQLVAVSKTLLYGNPRITKTMPFAVEFFHAQQPIGHTRTFIVYDFRQ